MEIKFFYFFRIFPLGMFTFVRAKAPQRRSDSLKVGRFDGETGNEKCEIVEAPLTTLPSALLGASRAGPSGGFFRHKMRKMREKWLKIFNKIRIFLRNFNLQIPAGLLEL